MQSGAEFRYDLGGNRTHIQTSGGASQKLAYDARGNIVGGEDGSQNRTTYRLDAWGRITGIVKADGSTEYYAYDYVGNMTMLHQMAEDYEVDPVYVLDMYRHGRLGVFAVLAAAKMGI